MNKQTKRRGHSRRSVLKAGVAIGATGVLIERARAQVQAGATAVPRADIVLQETSRQSPPTLTVERRGHVVLLGVNRPAQDNRIDPQTYGLLSRAYFQYEYDPSLRAAVLFGHGQHFSRGIDVEAFAPLIGSGIEQMQSLETIDPFGKSALRLSKPVVVVAHGDTWNIGHELCLAADIRIAAANTNFGQTEASQARMPGSGATIRFVRDAGWGQAMRYMLTGDYWTAEDAKRMGLFQEIASDPAAALELGNQIAIKIAACAPLSVQATIASAHSAINQGADKALLALNGQRQSLYATRDFQEALIARKEKRVPRYEGR